MSETTGQNPALRLKAYPQIIEAAGMEERFQNALKDAFRHRRKPRKIRAPVQKWGHLTSMSLRISSEQMSGFQPDEA
jgi:hypothetical protein